MYKTILTSVAIIALNAAFLNGAAAQASEAPRDLRSHTKAQTVETGMMGEARTAKAEALETYLMKASTLKTIETEFGSTGLKIIRRAYAAKIFKPLWTPSGAEALKDTIRDVFAHGILSEDVFSGKVDRIIKTRFQSNSEKARAKADVKLSLIWLRYARSISGTLADEGQMVKRDGSPNVRFSLPYTLTLSAAGEGDDEILALAPEAPQYGRLKAALAEYRALREKGGWKTLDLDGTLEPGDVHIVIPALRERVEAEGFYTFPASAPVAMETVRLHAAPDIIPALPEVTETAPIADVEPVYNPELYDPSLVLAIKAFQNRHGLKPDGIIGGNTLKALNETVESKINRIAESMYRWRVQGPLGERYIWANIPSYTAEGWNNGVREIKQRTIVGKRRFATPEFSDEVEYVVSNPKWYLPVSIVRRQKLPKLRQDPSYAVKNGYNIFDRATGAAIDPHTVDWSEPGIASQYRFIQNAGEDNALGDMKIMFPNQYSIYLHGTPGKRLFEKSQRAFSSGCVRLEDPVAMAKWISKHDDEADVAIIEASQDNDVTERVNLAEHLPVHITYFSVTVDESGQAIFWNDVYDRVDDALKYVREYENKRMLVAANE